MLGFLGFTTMTSSLLLALQEECGFFGKMSQVIYPFLFSVEAMFDRFLICTVNILSMNCSFKLIFIYAPPNHNLKISFQEELISYIQGFSCPYVVLGDFNELSRSKQDMIGGVDFSFARLNYMHRLLSSLECIELPFKDQVYTWRKKRCGVSHILERLDKGVTNLDWINLFPNAKLNHHVFTSSDHC